MKPSSKEPVSAVTTHANCPEWGIGGRFVIDLATGQRKRVDSPEPEEVVVGEEAKKTVKKKSRA